ncbi:rhodopsin, GQ-coupled-like [Magallana gigas]|uniref:rhodopsin, GQ-coupled-like n=1 Tax=Magallana gigas TaxID=29159 RepID=UPI003340ABED
MDSLVNLTESERLALWDNTRFKSFLPSTVFMILCAVVGAIGNGIVIYIYGTRLHRKYAGRYFIPYLAVADLFALLVSVELHTVTNSFPVTNTLEKLCKWNYVIAFFATVLSIDILLIIAVQRYLKVCKPFKGQMTLFWRRFALCLTFILSIPFLVPTYITFGLEKVYNKELNVTGTACRRLTSTTQALSLVHGATCTLLVVIIGIALIVLYIKIGKAINGQNKQNLGEPNIKKTNTSLMFMIITIIFLVSYLPRMITFLLEGIWAGLWETLTVEEYAIVRMLEVLYNVNHLANPFVYAFMDVKFVAELKKEISCGN